MKQQITLSSFDARVYTQVLKIFSDSFIEFKDAPFHLQITKATADSLFTKMAKRGVEEKEEIQMKLSEAEAILIRHICAEAQNDNEDPAILQSLRMITSKTDKMIIG